MIERSSGAAAATIPAGTVLVQGRPVALPVEVRDATALSAMFLVPTAAARRLLPHAHLHPLEIWPGRAILVLAAVEYRDNDLGTYNEFAVNLFVHHGPRSLRAGFGLWQAFRARTLGVYIHWLPVTTSFSRDAGRDIWGFPKTIAEITFRDVGGQRQCVVTESGVQVLTFSVRTGGGRRMPEMPQNAYAVRDGGLFRTPSVMSGTGVGTRLGGAAVTLGDHPRAAELRALGLPRRAVMSTFTAHMRATFQPPERP
jgi:hypothetical protein